ncbi:MAG: glycoside hydrolase family 78 protein [Propionibacteriaceae bacterium]|jgi:alpha-L-rhamnosidase|nr:glycoside hydrolase family 78 protein [Propionibacteriaceae bacterium]
MRVQSQSLEYGAPRLGLGASRPRLGWIAAGPPGERQQAYEVAFTIEGHEGTTGRVESADSAWVAWPGPELASREAFAWRVRLWHGAGEPGPWSQWQTAEVGLLGAADWDADWVVVDRRPVPEPPQSVGPAFLARAEFFVPPGAGRLRLHITAHGVFEAEVNGRPVADESLAPGWTDYRHRVVYRTFDLADLARPGRNAIGVTVADGWYRGRLGFGGGVQDTYGDDLAVLAQIEAGGAPAPLVLLGAGSEWRVSPSRVTASALYEGESWDLSLDQPDWSQPGFDAGRWRVAEHAPLDAFGGLPVAATLPPQRVTAVFAPVRREERATGRVRFDFGQNLAGRLRVPLTATARTRVELHHAEAVERSELATRPLRRAASVDSIELGPGDRVEFAPRFTVHGFRHAEVVADPAAVQVGDVTAEAIHTDFERTGWFECSNPDLSRLHENTVWSMRSNFGSLPTDCPQRDERLGWTGDIQVFAPTARYLFDCSGLLANWLEDLAWAQRDLGTVPNFVPWLELGFPKGPTAVWGDAAVTVPWELYFRTGDLGLLARQYESMRGWVDQIDALTGGTGLWANGEQLGDWLDPEAPPEAPDLARTDRFLVATAYHARCARLLALAAAALGEDRDAERYAAVSARAKRAFRREWVAPSGRVVSDTPTALTLAIAFDLLANRAQAAAAGRRLVETVWEAGYRTKTGFAGTPLICDALVSSGAGDDAYHLLLQDQCPSWLYPITMGATTIWERWDSLLPDGSVNPGAMTSFNHYAFGAVADFLHRKVAGLAPLAPGYRVVEVAPLPGGGLTWAKTSHRTPHGLVAVAWERRGGDFAVEVDLPPGVTADVRLPDSARPVRLEASGRHRLTGPCRAAADDPPLPRRVNIHAPDHKPIAVA